MPLIFPTNPTPNQTYQSGSSATYRWNGVYWVTDVAPTATVITATSASRAVSASFANTASLLTPQKAYFLTRPLANQIISGTFQRINIDQIQASGSNQTIAINDGVVSGLTVGKIYQLTAGLGIQSVAGVGSGSWVNYRWCANTGSNTLAIVGGTATPDYTGSAGYIQPAAIAIVSPTGSGETYFVLSQNLFPSSLQTVRFTTYLSVIEL